LSFEINYSDRQKYSMLCCQLVTVGSGTIEALPQLQELICCSDGHAVLHNVNSDRMGIGSVVGKTRIEACVRGCESSNTKN